MIEKMKLGLLSLFEIWNLEILKIAKSIDIREDNNLVFRIVVWVTLPFQHALFNLSPDNA
jgi:hypothetical protein